MRSPLKSIQKTKKGSYKKTKKKKKKKTQSYKADSLWEETQNMGLRILKPNNSSEEQKTMIRAHNKHLTPCRIYPSSLFLYSYCRATHKFMIAWT